mmetsp:Transcript_9477/g.27027  ORF Transcript_9477/g.27027 Transcript_9477/m.27027 type:complete len:172 (-) Transcript_9477:168-683(-)
MKTFSSKTMNGTNGITIFSLLILVASAAAQQQATTDCAAEIQDEMNRYHTVGGLSLALTVVNAIIRAVNKQRFQENPTTAYTFFFSMGAVKIILGILLFTVFWPGCPAGCSCTQTGSIATYPLIVLFIGFLWMYYGFQFYQLAKEGAIQNAADAKVEGVSMTSGTGVSSVV